MKKIVISRSANRKNVPENFSSYMILILLLISLSAEAQTPEWAGIWSIWGGHEINTKDRPFLKGSVVSCDWLEIEPQRGKYDFSVLDNAINEAIANGQNVVYKVYIGPGGSKITSTPDWLYEEAGVERIIINWNGIERVYPHYCSPVFKQEFKKMIVAVADHVYSYPDSIREKIIAVQAPVAKSGDEQPFSGEPVDEKWNAIYTQPFWANEEWNAYHTEMFQFFYDTYQAKNPPMPVIIKTYPASYEKLPYMYRKVVAIAQRYQLFNEVNYEHVREFLKPGHAMPGELIRRGRGEFDWGSKNSVPPFPAGSEHNWFTEAPHWNIYWTALACLSYGLDIWSIPPPLLTRGWDDVYAESFNFFNKYAGQKMPETANGAWIAFRDGLDSSDTLRFPQGVYGTAHNMGLHIERNQAIADGFKDYGAKQGDNESSSLAGLQVVRYEKALNDVSWRIYSSNYELYISQINEDAHRFNGGHGWWRVGTPTGPESQPYGRFARGLDTKVHGMNAIYLDINNRFFRNKPLAGEYPVTIRVVYWDHGGGKWKLTYDSTSDEKTAMVVQNGNTGRWVEKIVIVDDAHFGNRGSGGSDIALINSSDKECLFHMVEVRREK